MKQLRINRLREQARSHESNELAEISSVLRSCGSELAREG
jgi:hypothetical protein